jgi:hypothetical protein
MLVLNLSFAMLAVAMVAQSANAQASDKMSPTLEQALGYLSDGKEFQIDTIGLGNNSGDHRLRIIHVHEAASSTECPHTTCRMATFRGYYVDAAGRSFSPENVAGTINIIAIVRSGRVREMFTRIAFSVDTRIGQPGIVVGGAYFEGAIRFAALGSQERTFMAGTYIVVGPDGASSSGPFPFSGIPLPLYR